MPSAQHLAASQLDEEGVPIAIGLHSIADSEAEGALEAEARDAEPNAEQPVTDPQPALTGYDLVADMMRRQDEVLEQVDDLNARIELAIEQASAARKSEIEALEAAGQQLEDDHQSTNQQKAA